MTPRNKIDTDIGEERKHINPHYPIYWTLILMGLSYDPQPLDMQSNLGFWSV